MCADHGESLALHSQDTIVTDQSMGMTTTAGAAVFKHMKARRNADLVDRVRPAVVCAALSAEWC